MILNLELFKLELNLFESADPPLIFGVPGLKKILVHELEVVPLLMSFLHRVGQRSKLKIELLNLLIRLLTKGLNMTLSLLEPILQEPHMLKNGVLLMHFLLKSALDFNRLLPVNAILRHQFLYSSLSFVNQLLSLLDLLLLRPHQ